MSVSVRPSQGNATLSSYCVALPLCTMVLPRARLDRWPCGGT
jgi:hypothetical protein